MSKNNGSGGRVPVRVIAMCLTIVAVLWAALIADGNRSEKMAIKQARSDASNLALAFRENVKRTVSAIDQLMMTIIAENNESGDEFHIPAWVGNSLLLRGIISVQVSIVGPDGIIVVSKLGGTEQIDISDRAYFRYHLDPSASQPYISVPEIGRNSAKWSIQITRRLTRKDGSFGGVIVVPIDPFYFSQFFDEVDLGQNGVVDLIGRDGIVRARRALNSREIGQNVGDSALFKQMLNSSLGSEIVRSRLDGVARVFGYASVPDYPLVVTVGLATDDVLAGANHRLNSYFAVGGVLTLVIVTLSWFLARETKRRRKRELAAHAEEKIRDQKVLLDTALNNMSQGLVMFDTHGRVVIANRRYIEMYGLSTDVVRPGCTLHALIRHRKETGYFSGDVEQYCADIRAAIAQKRTTSIMVELTNERSIHIVNQPISTGGWIATHEDISEQRHAEKERDKTKRFLDSIIENIPIAIVVKDAKTRKFVLVNRAFETMIDLPRNELLDQTLFDIYRTKDAELIDKADSESLQRGIGVNYKEYEVETPMRGLRVHATNRIVIRNAEGDAEYLIAVIEDVTDRRKSEQQIVFMAHHDALTGLANRVAMAQKIEEAAARQRRFGEPFSVLLLDLDRFKYVNDTLGHSAGDTLLREVATRLKVFLRETDGLARLGGDEFAIIQAGEADQRQAASRLADRITEIIARPFDIDGTEVHIAGSIGIALAPDHATDTDSLLKMADMALYTAKSAGRNGYRFFDPAMSAAASERQSLETDLRRAIAQEELELHYQPIIDTKTGKVCGAEALVRWRHTTKGMIPPDQFIPLAEETGLITQIGEWVLHTACIEALSWPTSVKVAVNLSPVQFRKSNLPDVVMYALAQSGLPPERLELEITETALIESAADCLPALRQFKNLGIAVALDDFGTGYSSLSQLTMFPFDKIKIDKSFTQNLTKRAECAAIISATLTLAQSLDIATTAEGVETTEQYRLLRLAGVTSLQGYLFKRPGLANEIDFDDVYSVPELEDAA
jgi:diguanylate cyclase (GGDEF)-like protein/PAS domain S-box-containing protein